MPDLLDVQFMPLSAAPAGAVLLLAGQELALGSAARGIDERAKGADEGGPGGGLHRQSQDVDRGAGSASRRRG